MIGKALTSAQILPANERTRANNEDLFKVVSVYIRARARIPGYVCSLLSDIQCTDTNIPGFNQFEYIDMR